MRAWVVVAAGVRFGLMLVWRLAQESGGPQAAVSQLKGGIASLAAALMAAAEHHGAEIRTGARVASIVVENGRPAGVVLASGEVRSGRWRSRNPDARQTPLELPPPDAIGFGAAATVPEAAKVAEAKCCLR
jgi:phytoene dehydrogenase-like protein